MQRRYLTREQLYKVQMAVLPRLQFLNRLCQRIVATGIDPDDPLYIAAHRARDAMEELYRASDPMHGVVPASMRRHWGESLRGQRVRKDVGGEKS